MLVEKQIEFYFYNFNVFAL